MAPPLGLSLYPSEYFPKILLGNPNRQIDKPALFPTASLRVPLTSFPLAFGLSCFEQHCTRGRRKASGAFREHYGRRVASDRSRGNGTHPKEEEPSRFLELITFPRK